MTTLEKDILSALIELDTAAKSLRTANPKPDLQLLFNRLDELTRRLPSNSNPDLLHYMHKKSYQKARLLLEGREAENARGTC